MFTKKDKHTWNLRHLTFYFFVPSSHKFCQCNFLASEEMLSLIERQFGAGGISFTISINFVEMCHLWVVKLIQIL